jgi:hypothetical protein
MDLFSSFGKYNSSPKLIRKFQFHSVCSQMDEQMINYLEESGHDLIQVLCRNLPGEAKENHEN